MENKLKDHTQYNIGICKRLIENNHRSEKRVEQCLNLLKEHRFGTETILAGEKLAKMSLGIIGEVFKI